MLHFCLITMFRLQTSLTARPLRVRMKLLHRCRHYWQLIVLTSNLIGDCSKALILCFSASLDFLRLSVEMHVCDGLWLLGENTGEVDFAQYESFSRDELKSCDTYSEKQKPINNFFKLGHSPGLLLLLLYISGGPCPPIS